MVTTVIYHTLRFLDVDAVVVVVVVIVLLLLLLQLMLIQKLKMLISLFQVEVFPMLLLF